MHYADGFPAESWFYPYAIYGAHLGKRVMAHPIGAGGRGFHLAVSRSVFCRDSEAQTQNSDYKLQQPVSGYAARGCQVDMP
jgi:hypothetical protein